MQTGLLLVVGTIVSFLGWFFVYPVDGGSDASAAERAAQLMADPTLGKLGVLMGFGGMFAVFLGLLNIARGMAAAGGPGASYANVAAVIAMILLTLGALAISADFAVINASSAALGASIMQASDSSTTAFFLSSGLLLALLGIGIALEKNFHIIIAALAVIAGTLFIIGVFVEGENFGFAGWIGMMVTSLGLGGFLLIKQKS